MQADFGHIFATVVLTLFSTCGTLNAKAKLFLPWLWLLCTEPPFLIAYRLMR